MSVEQRVECLLLAGLRPLGLDFGPVAFNTEGERSLITCSAGVVGRVTFTQTCSKVPFAKAEKRGKKNDGNSTEESE